MVSADLPISQGQTVLYVEVGGTGDAISSVGGFNGGGISDGGGASDVRSLPSAHCALINSHVVVAGGGGGGGDAPGGTRAPTPPSRVARRATRPAAAPEGSVQAGCNGNGNGSPGSLGQGGAGNILVNESPYLYGAGGGGGYYGGGGGGLLWRELLDSFCWRRWGVKLRQSGGPEHELWA